MNSVEITRRGKMDKSNVISKGIFPIDIYADGPTLDEIAGFDGNLIKGYTFNPSLFRMLKVTDYLGHCLKLLKVCGKVPVSLEVLADDAGGMVQQARILKELGSNVYVKIPITFTSGETTLPVIELLVKDGLKLNITAILSRRQVQHILPALRDSGAIISVFAGRLFDIGIEAVETVGDIADMVHKESNCRVLWASPRMVYDIRNACAAHCDIITMKTDLIKKLSLFEKTAEEYSLETVKMFYQDAVASGYKLQTDMKEPMVFSFRPVKATNTLFLDRDGVLNHAVLRKSEISSPRSLDEFKIADDIDALAVPEIVQHWNLVLVSNQPDLARGEIDLVFLKEIHEIISHRIPLNEVYICPHQQSDGCTCRKPRMGLIQRFRNNHPELNGKECMVGDRISDWNCALKAKIPFVLRKRPYSTKLTKLTAYAYAIDDLWNLKTLLQSLI